MYSLNLVNIFTNFQNFYKHSHVIYQMKEHFKHILTRHKLTDFSQISLFLKNTFTCMSSLTLTCTFIRSNWQTTVTTDLLNDLFFNVITIHSCTWTCSKTMISKVTRYTTLFSNTLNHISQCIDSYWPIQIPWSGRIFLSRLQVECFTHSCLW